MSAAEAEEPRYLCYICLKACSPNVDRHVRRAHGIDPGRVPDYFKGLEVIKARRVLYYSRLRERVIVEAQIQDAKRVAILHDLNLDTIMLPSLKEDAIRLGIDLESPPVNLSFIIT